MRTSDLARLFTIYRIFIRYGLDRMLLDAGVSGLPKFFCRLHPLGWFQAGHASRAQRLRRALEDLGPIFIKLGQVLSTRRDLLPADVADELCKLQDKVPPFPGDLAVGIIEQAFDLDINDIFLQFDDTPLASASIAQVHAAMLHDRREVAVKVVRPGIEQTIRRDLDLMYLLARRSQRYSFWGGQLLNIIAEFEKTLLGELDMMREAANASQLRRNFADSDKLYVPAVYWELTRANVLTMERVSGIPIDDIPALRESGIDLRRLAELGIEIFFTEVLRDSFFHADMHPGNIFVSRPRPDQPARIIVVDFGIMSSLSEFDQRYLAENFMAFLNRDYRRVAKLHVESGWVPAVTRVDEFESAIRTVCEPLFDRPLQEIAIGTLLLSLFQTARRFDMDMLPQLLLLQKTLVNIEGLGRQLYPRLNAWETARPLFQHWMRDRLGVRGSVRAFRKNLPGWADKLPELPNKVFNIIDRLHKSGARMEDKINELQSIRAEIRRGNRATVLATIGSACILCAAVIFGLDGFSPVMIGGAPYLTWLFGFTGLVLLVFAARR